MAVIDEIPADLLPVLLPVAIGVVFVIVTVAIVFWLGSNRQRSFEEAKAQASKQADEVLRGKEYQNSPRAAKKGRRPRRQKRSDQGEESQEDIPPIKDEEQPRRSILKTPVVAAPVKEGTPERSPRSKVGFHLDTPPKEDNKTPRTSPPTPHPSKQQVPSFTAQTQSQRTVQPLFEEPEEEETTSSTSAGTMVSVKTKKPHPQTAVPSGGKTGTKKSKVKSKQQMTSLDSIEALPASRISDIVVSSSLSDEDIQQLMDVLLEKMNTNAEWQAASVRPENVKTLKKQNQDLHDKFEESQKTVLAHSNKIKELRAEIQNEKMRHQSAENGFQGKITAQNNEMAIARARMSGLEEELKQIKAQSSEKVEQENQLLKKQLMALDGVATSHKASLDDVTKQLHELQQTNAAMKEDLKKAKSSRSAEPKLQERVAELEGLVSSMEHEKEKLSMTLEGVSRDQTGLKAELQTLTPVREERDALKQQTISLMADNAKLRGELDTARQSSAFSLQTNDTSIREELERKNSKELERVREEMNSQHRKEVQELRETIAQLEGSRGEKEVAVKDLQAQVDKCSSLQEQLKSVSQQLNEEQGAKKELESEVETLRSSASSATGNGPVDVSDAGSGGEKLVEAVAERDAFKEQVKELEKKLEDLKSKNNSLRDSCWKAKDEAAQLEKVCEQKLKAAHIETEQRCKTVKTETLTKAREEQQAYLRQLFPSVKVDSSEFSKWLDEFEVKVEEVLKDYSDKISELNSELDELRENEQGTSKEEAEQIRKTLEITKTILEKLQSEVTKQQDLVIEKDVMLEREKVSNRALQEQLRGEKEASARLQEQLESIQQQGAESAASSRDIENRLSEVEERLKEAESERDNFKDEIGNLRSSLSQEVDAKTKAQQQAEEREKQLAHLNDQVASESQQRQSAQTKCQELEADVSELKQKLVDSEKMVDIMKSSNRELNATINSLSPTRKAKAESEV